MPLEFAVWRVDDESPVPMPLTGMAAEDRLQEIIASNVSIVGPDLMVIGREVSTPWGGRIDILAIDADGNLVVIELKRDRTPRQVVSQILEYGSWVRHMTIETIAAQFLDYQRKYLPDASPSGIDQALQTRFGGIPDEFNSYHRLIIVASRLDPVTERIVTYLKEDYSANLDFVLFRAFEDNGRLYLTRTWLDEEASFAGDEPVSAGSRGEWNGEFYVSFEEGDHRTWSDARKYGFVSAGGKEWHVRTLNLLEQGDRVWVSIPRQGYVGVGEVLTTCKRFDEFHVDIEGASTPIADVALEAPHALDEEHGEHFVGIKWMKVVDVRDAVRERGFFGNQNTVARPRAKKWAFTIERLKAVWNIDTRRTGQGAQGGDS